MNICQREDDVYSAELVRGFMVLENLTENESGPIYARHVRPLQIIRSSEFVAKVYQRWYIVRH